MYYGAIHETIAALDDDGYILLLQVRAGQWCTGNPAIAEVWKQLEHGIELDAAIAAAANGWVSRDQLDADIQRQLPKLVRAGILSTDPPADQVSRLSEIVADAQPTRRVPADGELRQPPRIMIAGAVGFVLAIMLKVLPFWWRVQLLFAVRRVRPNRPGSRTPNDW